MCRKFESQVLFRKRQGKYWIKQGFYFRIIIPGSFLLNTVNEVTEAKRKSSNSQSIQEGLLWLVSTHIFLRVYSFSLHLILNP